MTQKPSPVRIEVPIGFSGTRLLTNWNLRIPTNGATGVDGFGTNWIIAPVNLSISGGPSGCTASIVASDHTTPVSTINVNLNTNNTASNTNLVISLVFDGTEPSGTANVILDASGGGQQDDVFVLPVEVARIWNGTYNAALNGPGSFSDGTQWLGASAPQPNENVVFTDVGEQTNTLVTSATSTNFLTNCVISSSTAISSLRFCQLNNTSTNKQNIFINPGVTLGIGGVDGFKLLRDNAYWSSSVMNVAIYGTNGTLIQTNESSDFSILSDGQAKSVLDMSGLGNLQLDVNQLHLSDFEGYPNFACLTYSNNYSAGSSTAGSASPQRYYQQWSMANTNIIKAVFVDPYNYTNSLYRGYAFVLGRNADKGGSSGANVEISMGYSNVFNLDGMCIAGSYCLGGDLHFAHSGSYAMFRNANGVDRMSIFATADAGGGGTNEWGTVNGDNTKCGGGTGVDFTAGTIDMLVDRLYLSMDRSNVTAATKGVSQTTFTFASGTIDANTAIFGYQSQGDQTNQSYCTATMTVSNTAVFKINNSLTLGYSTASSGSPNNEFNGNGRLNVGPLGTVYANSIEVGGVTKLSTGDNISLSSGGSLVVSNNIADATPGGALGTLSFGGSGNCSLTLFIDGSKPAVPLVYVTNLTATGTGNKLIIGAVQNVSTFPADFPLIWGAGPAISPSIFDAGVSVGGGRFGTLYLSSSNTINIHLLSRAPHHLAWRGVGDGSTGTWDYTTANWYDQDTGLTTNYNNPDYAIFDDTMGYATNISIAGGSTPITPEAMFMTNSVLYYTFVDGGNQLAGGVALNKYGTGTLEVDANTTASVLLNQGTLLGGSTSPGAVGTVNVSAGATMNYQGPLSGSLVCAGVATSSGSIAGTLAVSPGGVVTNSGSLANSFLVSSNGFLYNSSSGNLQNIGAGSAGSPQVAAGGIFINAGTVGSFLKGNVLFVNGTFQDLGTSGITVNSVSIGSGGTFLPGGSGIGTTTINSDSSSTGFPGEVAMSQGSTNIFLVDPTVPQSTMVSAVFTSFGGSASARTQNGCTLVISNITATPFSAGQVFRLFAGSGGANQLGNTGTSTNTYPVIIPSTPGPGLVWDMRNLWIPNGSSQNGLIGVVSASSGPTLTNGGLTVTSSNFVWQLSWDPSTVGMSLQTLVVPQPGGINSTNPWTRIAGSWTNSSVTISNNLPYTNNVFYRLSFP